MNHNYLVSAIEALVLITILIFSCLFAENLLLNHCHAFSGNIMSRESGQRLVIYTGSETLKVSTVLADWATLNIGDWVEAYCITGNLTDIRYSCSLIGEEEDMPIRFTQYLQPDGRTRKVEIDMSPDVEALAQSVIDRGCWFDAEVLPTGMISLTCMAGEENTIAIELCPNGPEVIEAVKRLVQDSWEHLEKLAKLEE